MTKLDRAALEAAACALHAWLEAKDLRDEPPEVQLGARVSARITVNAYLEAVAAHEAEAAMSVRAALGRADETTRPGCTCRNPRVFVDISGCPVHDDPEDGESW